MQSDPDSFWYSAFLGRLRDCVSPEVGVPQPEVARTSDDADPAPEEEGPLLGNVALISEEVGADLLNEIEQKVDLLLGINPLQLSALRESIDSIAGAQSRLLELCRSAERVLGRWRLDVVIEALAHVPGELSDHDLMFLKRVLIPLAKASLRSRGTIRPRAAGRLAVNHLQYLRTLPGVTSTLRAYEELLYNRIALEVNMAHLLLRVCGFSWPSETAAQHAQLETTFDPFISPQIYATEALTLLQAQLAGDGLLMLAVDGDKFIVTSDMPLGLETSSTEYQSALNDRLRDVLSNEDYGQRITPSRPYNELPVVRWEGGAQNILKLVSLGDGYLDFSDPRKVKTLLRIRAALNHTFREQDRAFDLDDVINALPRSDRKKLVVGENRFRSERWRHDAFRSYPSYFDILFQPAGRGEKGKYLVNVQLEQ